MAAIFTVAEPGCRLEHRLDGGIGAAALRFVLGVEYDQRDVDHAALPDDDRRRIVEAALVEHASGKVADRAAIFAGYRHRAGEADVAAFLAAVPASHTVERHAGNAGLDPVMRVLELGQVVAVEFFERHRTARNAAQDPFDLGAVMGDDRSIAVEGEAHDPAAETGGAGDLVEHLVWNRIRPGVPVLPAPERARCADGVDDHRLVLDRALDHQWAQRFEEGAEVLFVVEREPAGRVDFGRGHQGDTHLRDDTVVRLGEHAVPGRTSAMRVDRPVVRVAHAAHAGAQNVAVRQHDFHAAMVVEMMADRGVAGAVLERVTDHATRAEIGHRHPELRSDAAQVIVEIEKPHTRLDQRDAVLLVHLQHAVHSPEAHREATGDARSAAAVALVSALAAGPNRSAVRVGDTQHRLHILDATRQQDGARTIPFARRRKRIGVIGHLLRIGQDVVRTDRRLHGAHGLIQAAVRQALLVQIQLLSCGGSYPSCTALVTMQARTPSGPSSLPWPDHLTPPNGLSAPPIMWLLMPSMPVSIS